MAKTVGDFLVERLRTWGVRRIYGYPGDGINGIIGALERAGDEHPSFIQVAARGDGGVHGLRARQVHRRGRRLPRHLGARRDPPAERPLRREDGPPAGRRHRRAAGARPRIGGDYQQEVDLQTLFKDVAHEYVHTAIDAGAGPAPASTARCRIALDRAHRHLRHRPQRRAGAGRRRRAAARARHRPLRRRLRRAARRPAGARICKRAAEVLNAGKKVAMLVGAGRAARAPTR